MRHVLPTGAIEVTVSKKPGRNWLYASVDIYGLGGFLPITIGFDSSVGGSRHIAISFMISTSLSYCENRLLEAVKVIGDT